MLLDQQQQKKLNHLPIKDLLMEQDLLSSLLKQGVLALNAAEGTLSIEQLNFKIYITKLVYILIHEREDQFIDFLKQPQMGTLFTDLLNLLFDESCKVLKTPVTLQLDWVE